MQVMDCINFMQLKIEKCCIDIQERTMKDWLKYFKQKNNKIYNTNKTW